MDEHEFAQHLLETFDDVQTTEAFTYRFFFVGEERRLPFVTMALDDADYDNYSNLSRPGVYRVNIGVSRETYMRLFGEPPTNETVAALEERYDFATLDTLMPHPEYAPQWWVCVLSPSAGTFEQVKPLLAEAHAIASRRGA